MRIIVLLLFATISPLVTLYSLEYLLNGVVPTESIMQVLAPKKIKQMGAYLFFIFSAITLFFFGAGDLLTLVVECLIFLFGYIAAMTDLFARKVPNKLILVMLGIWIFFALGMVFIDFERGMEVVLSSAIGFLIGAGLMLIIYLISRKGLGAGDVKFMGVAGLYLSYRLILAVMLAGGVLCLLTAIVLMIMKKLKLSDALPLVPFLYMGIVLVVLLR